MLRVMRTSLSKLAAMPLSCQDFYCKNLHVQHYMVVPYKGKFPYCQNAWDIVEAVP